MIHSAATVRFDHSLDEARRINVEGTRRILDFAAGARQLRSFAYVGTAYVAGERSDLVREDELAVGQSYRNTYEQTKAEAEALVRSRLDSLPGVILRPSIIVGDSRTGVTSSFKMMYWPLKIYARAPLAHGAWLSRRGAGHCAGRFCRQRRSRGCSSIEAALGSTVHLCAGPRGSATIEQVAAARQRIFQRARAALCRSEDSSSPWSGRCCFSRCGDASAACCATAAPIATTSPCACSSTPPMPSGFWSPPACSPPPVLDYLDRLFHYCVASDWGRKPVSAP